MKKILKILTCAFLISGYNKVKNIQEQKQLQLYKEEKQQLHLEYNLHYINNNNHNNHNNHNELTSVFK